MQTETLSANDMASPDASLAEQAARLEEMMPNILRRLFSIGEAGALADMPLAQLRICSFLMNGGRTMSAIAEELGISTSAVTQIADRMERAKLVERVTVPDDRRQKRLHLTRRARGLMEARRESRTRRAAEALARLPHDRRAALVQCMEQLLHAASKPTAPFDSEVR
jgi:DNA-binding MarR family transcriptional regulator